MTAGDGDDGAEQADGQARERYPAGPVGGQGVQQYHDGQVGDGGPERTYRRIAVGRLKAEDELRGCEQRDHGERGHRSRRRTVPVPVMTMTCAMNVPVAVQPDFASISSAVAVSVKLPVIPWYAPVPKPVTTGACAVTVALPEQVAGLPRQWRNTVSSPQAENMCGGRDPEVAVITAMASPPGTHATTAWYSGVGSALTSCGSRVRPP